MKLLDRLERRFGRFAIPNVTVYLVFGQSISYILYLADPELVFDYLALVPALVMQGEIWRLFLFLFMPPATNPIFAFFALYLLYLFGTALESHWGAFRYNMYLLIGYMVTVASAWVAPELPATNLYIGTSIFLAFAYLYPEFELLLFFILPVKVKWLAAITWGFLFFQFLTGNWLTRFLIQASVANFFLFFGKEITRRLKSGRRRIAARTQAVVDQNKPFHVCAVCGITDKTHPDMDFRYCPGCKGSYAYCTEHLYNHEHRT